MRPETQDMPTRFPQQAVRVAVAGSIARYLAAPVILVRMGQVTVAWAAMPKATVNKNGEALPAEDEVGMARNPLVTPPTCNTVGTEDNRQLYLRVFISPGTDSSHDLRALLLSKHVGHQRNLSGFFAACPR